MEVLKENGCIFVIVAKQTHCCFRCFEPIIRNFRNMSTQRRIHSYLTIIDKVKDNPGISKKKLLDILKDKDLVTSLRSLDRRIDELRTDFKLQMPFDHLN